MNLYQIKGAIATYFEKAVDDLIVNDVDIGLLALNQVRQNAEMLNDFEFQRKLLTLDVDGVAGGSLNNAVEYGTITPVVEVKTVVDVGLFDNAGNFRPVNWTTVPASLNTMRQDNRYIFRYPTDAQATSFCDGQRFVFSGNTVFGVPKTQNIVYPLGIEVYAFHRDWTNADLATDVVDGGDPWLTKGNMFLQWAAIIHLNHSYRQFVFRQEGNLPPPQQLADSALASLITWGTFKYEQFRRHDR